MPHIHIYTYIHIYLYIYICTYTHICIYCILIVYIVYHIVCVCVCVYVCVCVCVCVCIAIYANVELDAHNYIKQSAPLRRRVFTFSKSAVSRPAMARCVFPRAASASARIRSVRWSAEARLSAHQNVRIMRSCLEMRACMLLTRRLLHIRTAVPAQDSS